MLERWLPISGFEGFYEISNRGRVRSQARIVQRAYGISFRNYRIPEKILKVFICKTTGYLAVNLWSDKSYRLHVHRLVASTFLPNPSNKPEVNHKNGCRTDPDLENLEWATSSENKLHAHRELKRKSTKRRVVATKGKETINFSSITETTLFGFDPGNIQKCLRDPSRKHKGFSWKYADPSNQIGA